MERVAEWISPARAGTGFRWLLASSWVSNIGDGIALAAGPLLVAAQTRDPFLVALASLLQRVPWLLFGLWAGVLADRLDRRLQVVVADLLRAGVLAVLSLTIIADAVSVGVVLAAVFVLGTAEVFADTATGTLLPMLVERGDLGMANARLVAGFITANQLVGPPVGAALFAVGMVWPFAAQAVLVAMGAMLVSKIAVAAPVTSAGVQSGRRHVRTDVADGLRWVWGHAAVRTLTITIVAFNVTFGAAWSVLVLYSADRLGLGEIGFGLLTTASAIGGLLGSFGYVWLERRLGLATIMRAGLAIETCTHLALAITTNPAVAMVTFFVFGVHIAAWGTTSTSIRQRAVTAEFQGRVGSVYLLGVHGGLVVGAAIGGLIAEAWGVTGPFWFAFAGSVAILAAIWSQLGHIAHVDAPTE